MSDLPNKREGRLCGPALRKLGNKYDDAGFNCKT